MCMSDNGTQEAGVNLKQAKMSKGQSCVLNFPRSLAPPSLMKNALFIMQIHKGYPEDLPSKAIGTENLMQS